MSEARTVAVVVGGESGEHDVSLNSGAEVLANLDCRRWAPFVVRIERDGAWCFPEAIDVLGPADRLSLGDGVNALVARRPEVIFPVMHGPYGEDGRFQALCDLLHLPYAGSSSEASALAMNKARARDILRGAGLRVAEGQEIEAGDVLRIGAPCVVKPLRLGSSVGLSVVKDAATLGEALAEGFRHDRRLLVEAFVKGTELTAGVLEAADGTPEALPLVEIRPLKSHFFDYRSKYDEGGSEEICPAPVSEVIKKRVQSAALVAHKALGCRGMSRTDVIVDSEGRAFVLETNTIPGMTRTSLLPQAAAAAGISFAKLLDRILERALSPA